MNDIKTVNWYRNEQLYTSHAVDRWPTDTVHLNFESINSSLNGNYFCEILFFNGQKIRSNNTAQISFWGINIICIFKIFVSIQFVFRIEGQIPQTPVIKSVLPIKYSNGIGVLIQWNINHLASPITCVIVSVISSSNNLQQNFIYYRNYNHALFNH